MEAEEELLKVKRAPFHFSEARDIETVQAHGDVAEFCFR